MSIGLIILAAGSSSRLGAPKQLIPYEGTTLLRHSAEAVLACQACNRAETGSPTDMATPSVIALLGAHAERVGQALEGLALDIVCNPSWHLGIGSSIRYGMQALLKKQPDARAVAFFVSDQPYLSTAVVDALIGRFDELGSGRRIVASNYGRAIGVPALFDRSLFGELAAIADDTGARQLIERHAAIVDTVPFPNGDIDIDTPADVTRLAYAT